MAVLLMVAPAAWCRSPGAAVVMTGNADALHPVPGSAAVLWQTPEFVLVVPGSTADETVLANADTARDLYLVQAADASFAERYSPAGTIVPITGNYYLLELPSDFLPGGVLPEHAVYLGYPSLQITAETDRPEIPGTVTWDSQVQSMVDAVSQTQLVADLTTLADFQTRYSYTNQCRLAGEWLGTEFENLGYMVTYHEHDRTMAPNVIAEKPGISTQDEIVIICGHYDSVSLQPLVLAPGADDNGTGSAAVLNAARVMAGKYFNRTIRFIAFSGEEEGLRGSQAYAQQVAAMGESIVGVINLDMIGYVYSAPGDLEVIGNTASESLVDLFIDSSETYTTLSTNRLINGSITASDHASFWVQGYPALLGIEDYPVRYPHYHTIQDTVDKVTPEFMTESVKAAVATVAHLADPMMEVVYIFSTEMDDSSGDGDGYFDPGETVDLRVSIMNNSTQSSGSIQMNLICLTGAQYVTVLNNSVNLPSIDPGEQVMNTDNPFTIQIHPDVPEFTQLTCIIALDCDAPHSSGSFYHQNITSYTFQDAIVMFDMDTDPGWSMSDANWQWGIPSGQGGDDHGHPDPTSGYTGNHVLGNNMDGDYPANIDSTVTSPVLDLTDVRMAELRFERWLNIENPTYDQAEIRIITNDDSYRIWMNPLETTDNGWQPMALDISEYADGRDDVRIMFSLRTDGGWEYSGWNIDDVRIAGLAPGDPLPTPTPLFPPDTIGVKLNMADTVLDKDDDFNLAMQWWNTTAIRQDDLPVFVILDIADQFWFWPDWSHAVSYETRTLPPGTIGEQESLLEFQWPDVAGAANGLRFWSAFTTAGLTDIFGISDMIEWEYR